jgi:predicted Zn-dependent protease
MTRDHAQELTKKALENTEGEASISLSDVRHGFARFARNTPTTSGLTQTGSAVVRAWKGKREASVSGSVDLTNPAEAQAELRRLLKEARELAAISPEDREYMPLLGPQKYIEVHAYDPATGEMSAKARATALADAIATAEKQRIVSAGFYEHQRHDVALANSAGLFAYHRGSFATFSVTARTPDEKGSGYTAVSSHNAGGLDVKETVALAARKAIGSRGVKEIKPSAYPTILEPQAVADIVGGVLTRLSDARLADEGRSVFAAPEGKTRLGQKIFDSRISMYGDPAHPTVPSMPFNANDGYPIQRADFVKEGVLENLQYSRFWAAKNEKSPGPFFSNVILEGSSTPLSKLIASMERGVLVTRLWYIRPVDLQQALFTGLTRDGTFWIEDGKIRHPLKNFRFNESPYQILANVEELGQTLPVVPGERHGDSRMLMPSIKVKSFRFTSISDAI